MNPDRTTYSGGNHEMTLVQHSGEYYLERVNDQEAQTYHVQQLVDRGFLTYEGDTLKVYPIADHQALIRLAEAIDGMIGPNYSVLRNILEHAAIGYITHHIPNAPIAKHYDYFLQETDQGFMSVGHREWIDGITLAEMKLEEVGDIPQAFIDLALFLDQLKRIGIVHHDIKPENIIWDNNEQRLKLIDFESVYIIGSNTKNPSGTPLYAPPESSEGFHRCPSPAADGYSLILTFFETLYGVNPEAAKSLDTNSFAKKLFPSAPVRGIFRKSVQIPEKYSDHFKQIMYFLSFALHPFIPARPASIEIQILTLFALLNNLKQDNPILCTLPITPTQTEFIEATKRYNPDLYPKLFAQNMNIPNETAALIKRIKAEQETLLTEQ